MATNIQVVFYSMYGHIYQMTEAVAAGAREVQGAIAIRLTPLHAWPGWAMVAADMSEPMANLRGSGSLPVQVADDQSSGANRRRRVIPDADLLPAT
jgi:hypothetical protein